MRRLQDPNKRALNKILRANKIDLNRMAREANKRQRYKKTSTRRTKTTSKMKPYGWIVILLVFIILEVLKN